MAKHRTKVAEYLETLEGFTGVAKHYKLSPPLVEKTYDEDAANIEHTYVVVSAVEASSGPETYIFPADKEGKVLSFLELDGSSQGDLDHEAALARAGYETKDLDSKSDLRNMLEGIYGEDYLDE